MENAIARKLDPPEINPVEIESVLLNRIFSATGTGEKPGNAGLWSIQNEHQQGGSPMSNIDKRALREVAEKATPGNWHRASSRFNGITVTPFSLCDEEVMLAHAVEKRDAEFIAAANPATMLALLDENLQLQREKDAIEAVALALRDDMRQAREQLEAGWKQNATDVQIKARLCRESNSLHDRLREAEKRIAELEAREVSVSEIRKNKFIEKTEDELDGDHYTICKNG